MKKEVEERGCEYNEMQKRVKGRRKKENEEIDEETVHGGRGRGENVGRRGELKEKSKEKKVEYVRRNHKERIARSLSFMVIL